MIADKERDTSLRLYCRRSREGIGNGKVLWYCVSSVITVEPICCMLLIVGEQIQVLSKVTLFFGKALHYTRTATAGMIAAGGWRIHVSKKNSKSI